MASKCEWEVYEEGTIGSDITSQFYVNWMLMWGWVQKIGMESGFLKRRLGDIYGKSDLYISLIQETNKVERKEMELRQSINMAAMAAIPKGSGKLV